MVHGICLCSSNNKAKANNADCMSSVVVLEKWDATRNHQAVQAAKDELQTVNTDLICAVGPCTAPSYTLNRMLPRVKPDATVAPLFCLWNPSTTPLPGKLLLLYSWKA